MLRVAASLVVWMVAAGLALPVRAQDSPPTRFPDPVQCSEQPDDPTIADKDKPVWTHCEKWAWSCIRQGLEANFFDKTACQPPRTTQANELRKTFRLAAFNAPQRYETANGLGSGFLLTILSDPHYVGQIPPIGLRLFGAYFKDPINLENMTTALNVVLDASMMQRGLRLTNFKTEKNLSLDGSNIRGSIFLMRARIDGSLFMEMGIFDSLDLNDVRIGASFEASGSVFNDNLRLHRAEIAGKVILTKARLTTLSGWNARLGASLEMRLADIRYGVDLSGSTIAGDVRMQDATFGRLDGTSCDWNPDRDVKDVITDLRHSVPPADFDAVWRDAVALRPTTAGRPQPNVCKSAAESGVFADYNNVLLRDMKIKGALCLVDVTGEITPATPGATPISIGKIALDGTEANATILSWKASSSDTLWYLANYKTNYLQTNLQNRPSRHYTDNVEVGALTMMKHAAIYPRNSQASLSLSDEYRVREKCDVTPGIGNTDAAGERDVQDRIIAYFKEDLSASSQPFAEIVKRIDSMGANTTYLKVALSEHQYRNACASSQLMKTWNELPWRSLGEKLSSLTLDEARKFTLDGLCHAAISGYRYSVSYGHEPHNIFLWALLLVVLFNVALLFDRHESGTPRNKFGMTYALDNLNPLKPYRLDREKAEERPSRLWLRVYLHLHRLAGIVLAILAFLFIYRASK